MLYKLYAIDSKCRCTNSLSEQQNGTGNNAIMCEKNGREQPSGQCSEDEYCAGPDAIENAECGKFKLCTKKGILDYFPR